MNNTSPPLSVLPEQPVAPAILAVMRALDEVARQAGAPYFVAGAMARDLVLTHVYGIAMGRATRDVDFAIAVASWAQFEAVKQALAATGDFTPDPRARQRLLYRPPPPVPGAGYAGGMPVDIIPFGGVVQAGHQLAWPPDLRVLMNVAGYTEVLAAAVLVEAAPGLAVRVASLPGLALLKLFAWADRWRNTLKDAQDLLALFRSYLDAGNRERLYAQDAALFTELDYQEELAAPRLLGQDVRHLAAPATARQAAALLDDPLHANRLALHMARDLAHYEDGAELAQAWLRQFRIGLGA